MIQHTKVQGMTTNKSADRVCPSCGRPITRCAECNKIMYPARSDAMTCSSICRTNRSVRLRRLAAKQEAS